MPSRSQPASSEPRAVRDEPREDHVPGRTAKSSLTPQQTGVLEFERRQWRRAGSKEVAIREELGISVGRYYQLLNALLDSPDALRHDPMLVKRLRRIRDARVQARAARVFPRPSGLESD